MRKFWALLAALALPALVAGPAIAASTDYRLSRLDRDLYRPHPQAVAVAISDSTAITGATETEAAFNNDASIPANVLREGSRIFCTGLAKHTATSGSETHSMIVEIGGAALLTVAAIDPANSDYFYFDMSLDVVEAGASGSLMGAVQYRTGAATGAALNVAIVDGVAIDTTAANAIELSIDRQASATDGDSAKVIQFACDVRL